MPEAAVATPPASTQTPAPGASGGEGGDEGISIAKLVGVFDKPDNALPGEGTDPKPGATKTPKDGTKPPKDETKPPGDETKTPKTETPPAPDKPSPKLFTAHEELKKTHKTLETTHQALVKETEGLRSKLREYESRPAAPDPKVVDGLKSEIDRLQGELREVAYERSADYKRDFIERRDTVYKEAVETVSQLRVSVTDPESGEVAERPATEADLRQLYYLPAHMQDKAIHDMFGPSAHRVASYINELGRITRDAAMALKRERETGAEKAKQREQEEQQFNTRFEEQKARAQEELETKWPDFFKVPPEDGDNGDKEVAVALKEGYAIVDELTKNGPKMKFDDRVAYSAVIRARAAAFPAMHVKLQRALAEVAELKKQIGDAEGADPGSATRPAGGAPKTDDDAGGIEAMARQFDPKR